MKVLIESGNTNNNWGDFAMLQVAVQRIKRLHPTATICLLGHAPDERSTQWPVEHIDSNGRRLWNLHRGLAALFRSQFPAVVDAAYEWAPHLMKKLVDWKLTLQGIDARSRTELLQAFDTADAFLVSGMGGITDVFPPSCDRILNLIHLALARQIPVVLLSQGIGPLNDQSLLKKARRVLPKVDMIALREKRTSFECLLSLSVPEERIVVTGDDAISLAYQEKPEFLGTGIGVNLRRASYVGVNDHVEKILSESLSTVMEANDAPLLPVPIQFQGTNPDTSAIQRILANCGVTSDGGSGFNNLQDVIQTVSLSRVVVTSSYHAGVFALAQGIPVVAITNSQYYDQKFAGLADQFGGGCTILRADNSELASHLTQALFDAWEKAPVLRSELLRAARKQIDAAESAYHRAFSSSFSSPSL